MKEKTTTSEELEQTSEGKTETQQQATKNGGQPAYIEELLKNGTVVLQAKTSQEIAEMVNNIPAETKYISGAVGRTRDGIYTLRIDIDNQNK